MTNDINTLNGALMQLGETLATNLNNKGVTASASDGLTTLANKINQIPTGECYFLDTLNTSDYILRDSTIASVSVDGDTIKIENTAGANKSVFVTLNRGPFLGNWKATYEIKTNNSITLYSQIGGTRTGNSGQTSGNINTQTFKKVEWIVNNGNMSVTIDGNALGNTITYTPDLYYPIMAFYFNANEYVNIKNFKVVKI